MLRAVPPRGDAFSFSPLAAAGQCHLEERRCEWCGAVIDDRARSDAKYCRQICRQIAFRLRRRKTTAHGVFGAARFGYADPPYPGKAHLYKREPSYAGEVDHKRLIERLEAERYLGWALSTSSESLRAVLNMCPDGARACPWVKPMPVPKHWNGLATRTEYLIVVRGRQIPPGVPDFLCARPDQTRGESLVGRKPLAFVLWMFQTLGMRPEAGDTIDDWYPGTEIVSRAWSLLVKEAAAAMPARHCR